MYKTKQFDIFDRQNDAIFFIALMAKISHFRNNATGCGPENISRPLHMVGVCIYVRAYYRCDIKGVTIWRAYTNLPDNIE